jgi:putative acetyltransferase
MVEYILAHAREQGYRRVSLETGTTDDFAVARALYTKAGFWACEPFGDYTTSPYNTCMTLTLNPHSD